MTNNTDDTSDIKKAADHADAAQIKKNLEGHTEAESPENLTEDEKTSFIDEDARTDK